jgi:hypothetical protein
VVVCGKRHWDAALARASDREPPIVCPADSGRS